MSKAPKFIHRFVPAQGEHSRALLLLHGTGGDEMELLGLGSRISPGSVLVSPRGKIDENGMNRFFRRLSEGVFDIPDVVARVHELADFVEWARKEYALGERKIIAVGYSNGANVAAAMLLLRPEALQGAVLLRPMIPLHPEENVRLDDIPVLITAGEQDKVCRPPKTRELEELLVRSGAEVTTSWQPVGHQLTGRDVELATEWMRRL